MAREDPQLKLRLTEEMKNEISRAAQANGRSVNAEIVARLAFSLDVDLQMPEMKRLAEDAKRNLDERKKLIDQNGRLLSLLERTQNRFVAMSSVVERVASMGIKDARLEERLDTAYQTLKAMEAAEGPEVGTNVTHPVSRHKPKGE